MPSAAACSAGCLKPPFVDRATVVVAHGVSASHLLSAPRGAHPALDDLARTGSSALLAGDAVCVASLAAPRIEYIDVGGSLARAEQAVRAACAELVIVVVTGPGDWKPFFGEVRNPADLFPIPRQTAGDARLVGIAVWAGTSRTRIDERVALAQKDVAGGEGTLTVTQFAGEVLSKVGARPKFGA